MKKNPLRIRRIEELIVILHDAAAVVLAVFSAAMIILPIPVFADSFEQIQWIAVAAAPVGFILSAWLGVFSTRWRIASLTDFVVLLKSGLLLTSLLYASLWVIDYAFGEPPVPAMARVAVLTGIFTVGLQASGRIAYRYYRLLLRSRENERRPREAVIFVGSASELEGALRASEQGIVAVSIVGGLLLQGSRWSRSVRGTSVLGYSNDLESSIVSLAADGISLSAVFVSPTLLSRAEEARSLKRVARRLGLNLLKFEAVDVGGQSKVNFEEFLFRKKHEIDFRKIDSFVSGKRVLVSGGGGTIGGDIALRSAAHGASNILLLDISELGLQKRLAQLRKEHPECQVSVALADVRDVDRLMHLVMSYRPDVIIHAAALKHVDLTEENWQEAIKTNVFGTRNMLVAADAANTPTLVNISTDKAAAPIGVLGLTKRFAEHLVANAQRSHGRRMSVRFGNVLGSSGSVIEVFLDQIAQGGPITLTHPDVRRYFMSRDEAAQLVLLAAAQCGTSTLKNGSLFILDMGEQILIKELATELIEWAGLQPDVDIGFRIVGLRPGERIQELLYADSEVLVDTEIAAVKCVLLDCILPAHVEQCLQVLADAVAQNECERASAVLKTFDGSAPAMPGVV